MTTNTHRGGNKYTHIDMVRQQLQASKHGWTTPLRNAGAIKAQLPGGADGAAANLFVYKKAPLPLSSFAMLPQTPTLPELPD